ncbi:hypothetical protein SAMN05421504_106527 [Amycolatopsis xylanica]|uniref:Peptidase inhibitor family I36 n=1 Tax=Amycolatopsis xylanica TaxID=589385 RepID=A0A1H3M7F0_9PSEU|nr:hypothetical protein SAMN05421504_106527 [Amycolatopsis xylanica]
MNWSISGERTRRLIVAAVVGAATVAAMPGVAAAEGVDALNQGKYCAMLVDKAPEGKVSPVLAEICSDTSAADVDARIVAESARIAASRGVEAAAPIPIMYWYENIHYNLDSPGGFTTIYGNSGSCDSSGYRVEPSSWWKARLSSLLGNNDCYAAKVHNRALSSAETFGLTYGGSGWWLGGYSDNVGLVQAYNG